MMDRCELALQYHHSGYNCAQSVLMAFADLTKLDGTTGFAVTGGLGGGVGATHQELCGAANGAVIALGLLFPFTDGADAEGKRRVYAQAKEFLQESDSAFQHQLDWSQKVQAPA